MELGDEGLELILGKRGSGSWKMGMAGMVEATAYGWGRCLAMNEVLVTRIVL